MPLTDQAIEALEKKGYRFVGSKRHAAAKVCHWTKKSIMDDGVCYKEKFYGIESHRCLQMSPSIAFCHHKCLFCWRDISITSTTWEEEFDDPGEIIDECIKAQRKLLVGFFGNPNANSQKIAEAQDPTNAAISLAGEPLLYPSINQLLEEYKKRKFTTFLVSNGLSPDKLGSLDPEPTQLYLSLDAPNIETYKKLCDPQIKDGWEKLNHSLDLLSSFNCRTVIRMTSVAGYNMTHPEEYARIIEKSDPDFVEIKAYMYVGSSRDRLKFENMPRSNDLKNFAQEIASLCGRKIVDESPESRVVLLA
ncbi:4-demethylwyosine synthase TYW1 [Methanobacterium formicicum]|uniref:S-adenosyl-L-methionine-dependent tRNA 4-demethylwyosine synthase n=1 Tax=Methanobacterium formicicum (strain DSM 3637 / PP1) TaxID=1204725 RepID=K2QDM7_METFP|nr:4-demethylwyosine synthase TYW1 [Methanobacterium formicicum]EKF86146.1 tRNA-modifying enzyme [Methanobacterium formicicum DSM 3637]